MLLENQKLSPAVKAEIIREFQSQYDLTNINAAVEQALILPQIEEMTANPDENMDVYVMGESL